MTVRITGRAEPNHETTLRLSIIGAFIYIWSKDMKAFPSSDPI
jgi:hypothetical protein